MTSVLDVDLSEVDDGQELMPDGPTTCLVASIKEKHVPAGMEFAQALSIAESGGSDKFPGWEIRLKPQTEKFKNRTLFLNLSMHPNARWNVKRFAAALALYKDKRLDIMGALNRRITVTVATEPSFNDPTQMRNSVQPPYHAA